MDVLHNYRPTRKIWLTNKEQQKYLLPLTSKTKFVPMLCNKLKINGDLSNTFKSLVIQKMHPKFTTLINNCFQDNQFVVVFITELPLRSNKTILPMIVDRV
jgi:hypothetical protein